MRMHGQARLVLLLHQLACWRLKQRGEKEGTASSPLQAKHVSFCTDFPFDFLTAFKRVPPFRCNFCDKGTLVVTFPLASDCSPLTNDKCCYKSVLNLL